MQKKLIALAIAGLSSTAAFAQSNVTVYGVVDLTVENVKASGATTPTAAAARPADLASRNRVTSNSSYLGFKGEEGLGNGLKAKFLFEAGFNPDNGGGALTGSTRDGWVALESGFGEVRLGQYNTAVRSIGSTIDFAPGYTGIGTISNLIGTFRGIKTGSDDRISNAVGYFSPNFSGFQVSAQYGANEGKLSASNNGTTLVEQQTGKRYDLGATYNNGPLFVGLAYDKATDPAIVTAANATIVTGVAGFPATNTTSNSSIKNTRLGAKYTFPSATTISALWDQQKITLNSLNDAAHSGSVKRSAWQLGVKQDFGVQSVYVTYVKAGDVKGGTALTDTGAKQWTLGYLYNLSKRTQVKAYYTSLKNEANNNTDFYNGGLTGVANGADPKGYGVGLRHSF
jgi:predicted porin